MEQLIQVQQIPKTARKDGEPVHLDNGAVAQDYRDSNDDLYEHVTLPDGSVRIFKLI